MQHVFVVCQHGSHGRLADFDIVKGFIHAQAQNQPGVEVTTWDTDVNTRWRSDKGTAKCGQALYESLKPVLHLWIAARRGAIAKAGAGSMVLSCVGHSFGGVLLRELIHTLCQDEVVVDALDVQKDLRFGSFVSAATPHCGVAMLSKTKAWGAYLIGKLYSQTYLDLLMSSDFMWRTMLTAPYLNALRRFERRVSFSNVHKDPLVPFSTSALCFDELELKAVKAAFGKYPDRRMLPEGVWQFSTPMPAEDPAPPHPIFGSTHDWAAHTAAVLRRCGWDVVPVRYDGFCSFAHSTMVRTTVRATVMEDVAVAIASAVLSTVVSNGGVVVPPTTTAAQSLPKPASPMIAVPAA